MTTTPTMAATALKLVEALPDDSPGKDEALADAKLGRTSGTDQLVQIARDEGVVMFVDQDGRTFARTPDHRILHTNGAGIGSWLAARFYALNGKVPPKDAATDAGKFLTFEAEQSNIQEDVWLRVGRLPYNPKGPNGIAIDLGDAEYNAVVITDKDWTVEPHPINFLRTLSMAELPVPTETARAADLDALLVTALRLRPEDRVLATGWVIAALEPTGPYAVMNLTGAPGSGKSMRAKLLRRLIDPVNDKSGGVKSMPRNEDDWAAIVSNNMVPALDNINGLTREQANWVCQASTGYGKEKRRLYTDGGTYIRSAECPVILNGVITNEHGDLASRSIALDVPPLEATDVGHDSPHAAYATGAATVESELYRVFDQLHPQLFGALCDAVSHALEELPKMPKGNWPRMAEVCRFVSAAEGSLGWEPGTFAHALQADQADTAQTILATEPWWGPLTDLLAVGNWTGTYAGLLTELRASYEGEDVNGRPIHPASQNPTWPKSARALSGQMAQNSLGLAAAGVTVGTSRHNGATLLTVSRPRADGEPVAGGEPMATK